MTSALRRLVARYRSLPRALRWTLPGLWAAAIWWASSQSQLVTAEGTGWSFVSNGAHFVIFGTLAALVFLACEGSLRQRAFLAIGLTLAYAIIDEWHQSMVPGRVASVWDVASDLAGGAWCTLSLAWLHSGDRRARNAMLALLPVGLLFVSLATFGSS